MKNKDKIQNYIKKGQLAEAITELHKIVDKDLLNDIALLGGRFNMIQEQWNIGSISRDSYLLARNQIAEILLNLSEKINDSTQKKKIMSQNHAVLLNKYLTVDIQPEEIDELETALNEDDELFAFTEAFNAHNRQVGFQRRLEKVKKERVIKKKWLKVSYISSLGIAASFALFCYVIFTIPKGIHPQDNLDKHEITIKEPSVPLSTVDSLTIKNTSPPLSNKDKIAEERKRIQAQEQQKILTYPRNRYDSIDEKGFVLKQSPNSSEKKDYEIAYQEVSKIDESISRTTRGTNTSNIFSIALDSLDKKAYESVIKMLLGNDQSTAHYLLGTAYFMDRQFQNAEKEFLILNDKDYQFDTPPDVEWKLLMCYLVQPDKKKEYNELKDKIRIKFPDKIGKLDSLLKN